LSASQGRPQRKLRAALSCVSERSRRCRWPGQVELAGVVEGRRFGDDISRRLGRSEGDFEPVPERQVATVSSQPGGEPEWNGDRVVDSSRCPTSLMTANVVAFAECSASGGSGRFKAAEATPGFVGTIGCRPLARLAPWRAWLSPALTKAGAVGLYCRSGLPAGSFGVTSVHAGRSRRVLAVSTRASSNSPGLRS